MLLLFKSYDKKDRYDKCIENCTGPAIVYDFSMKNLDTFEDNLKYKGDLPLTT